MSLGCNAKMEYEIPEDFDGLVWKRHPLGYFVSMCGRVYSPYVGEYMKTDPAKNGYVKVSSRVSKGCGLHTAVYETFIGPIPSGMQINHIDGIKHNNKLSNLELCTPAQNVQHAHRVGLSNAVRGEDHTAAKLKNTDVLSMYDLFSAGYTNDYVASLYGVHSRYVSLIRHGKRWKHLHSGVSYKSLGRGKYTLEQRLEIVLKCLKTKKKNKEIWEDHKYVDLSTISKIKSGKTWQGDVEFFRMRGLI